MSYTVHYLDGDWDLQMRCLQTLYGPEDHTAMNLCSVMTETLQSRELEPSKQVCMTTDNGANLIRACKDLGWMRLPCFGHNLHLAIQNAIKDDSRLTSLRNLPKIGWSFFVQLEEKEGTN